MKVNRIYHLRPSPYITGGPMNNGGATVLVEGDTNHAQVAVKIAYCNPTDTYNKKLGRAVAAEAKEKVIPLRALPGFLGTTYREVHRRAKVICANQNRNQFDNRVLDFLPKDLGA